MPIKLMPLVLPIDQPATLTVEGLAPRERYVVRVRSRRLDGGESDREMRADETGRLRVEGTYTVRGEHTLDVYPTPPTDRLARLPFYVAPPDLFSRRPLRGDFHIHTTYSDGHSSPAEMLIRGRELGLDVAVITDHNAYQGSIEAIQEHARLGLNLITTPGEEVSGPNWHVLSINARTSIHDLARAHYGLESGGELARWNATTAREYDALRWAIEATQAHGGRAYLAHPYWAVERGYHLPAWMYERVLADDILDGLELLGDVRYENNVRSLARYLDYRAAGHDIPIIGNSDTHRTAHTYGTYWTLVFAANPTAQGVLDAIRDGWSVACTTVEAADLCDRADALHAFGTYELVDFCLFLEQQFYPWHDALCVQEASLAYRAWRGEKLPQNTMDDQKTKMEALYAQCWGK